MATAATTFFGNQVRCKLLNTWSAVTVTMTNGSTAFSGGSCSAGDYVWITADGIWNACKVVNSTTLSYAYLGAGGTTRPGYKCTPETLAVLRGLECNVTWETADLYGTDSVLRVAEAKHSTKVNTKIKYCYWNPDVTVDWMSAVIHPSTTADGTIQNTNVCYLNGVVYTIRGTSGDYLELVCGKSYWGGFPSNFPENDFMIRDVSGKATSVAVHKL
jgi:hypothetical protein